VKHAPWSLASRLTKLFAITTSSLVLGITIVSTWYLSRSTEQTIRDLLHEENQAMMNVTDVKGRDPQLHSDAAPELQRNHPKFPLAWRVWRSDGSTVWATAGKEELFRSAQLSTAPRLRGEVQKFSKDLCGIVEAGSGDLVYGCVLDATARLSELRRYSAIGLILVFATIAIIFAVGHVMVGRVSRTLRQVATKARTLQGSDETMQVDLGNAPQEVHEVADALQEMLSNVRREAERNRVFTASLAHELRSPIQNLMGETEVALMTQRDGTEYRRVLHSHLQELRDLADAVDNLVTICSQRKGEGNMTQTRESFELAPEAKLRLARESGYATARGVDLKLDSLGDTRVYGDREGLLRDEVCTRRARCGGVEQDADRHEARDEA
jgi:signal transduction histidine kinase